MPATTICWPFSSPFFTSTSPVAARVVDRHREPHHTDEPGLGLAALHEDDRLVAQVNDGGARNREPGLAVRFHRQRRPHLRLEQVVLVRKHAADLGGARGRVEGARDPVDAAGKGTVGIGRDAQLRGAAHLQPREIVLVDVGEHPDLVDVADGEELRGAAGRVLALHFHAGIDCPCDHLAVDGSAQDVALRGRAAGSGVQHPQALRGALELGPGSAIVVFGRFVIHLRGGMLVVKALLPFEVVLGRGQVRPGLSQIRRCVADVRRFNRRERIALANARADRRVQLHDPARHRREHVRHALVVEGHAAIGGNRAIQHRLLHSSDLDLLALQLVLGQPEFTRGGPGARDLRGLRRVARGAGKRCNRNHQGGEGLHDVLLCC